jgi:hypothetical protein
MVNILIEVCDRMEVLLSWFGPFWCFSERVEIALVSLWLATLLVLEGLLLDLVVQEESELLLIF